MAENNLIMQYARALGAAEACLATIKLLSHGRNDNSAAILRCVARAEADIAKHLPERRS